MINMPKIKGSMTETQLAPQYVKYTFFTVDPLWRGLSESEKKRSKEEFSALVASSDLLIRAYSLMGMRSDAELLLWLVSPDLEGINKFATLAMNTRLGQYLTVSHSYLAMTRRSTYIDEHSHENGESRTRIRPMGRKYLFVYPFVKTHAWYQLSLEERQRMMNEHFKVGHLYPEVKVHTTYSFGLDDQEFVLGFETDDPSRFLDLVMELRSAEQRPYTEKDTPIFTCLLGTIEEVLDSIG